MLVSILNGFSKIYERFINNNLSLNHVNDILSDSVSAYWSKYSSKHMILRLIEEWKEKLDKGFFAGAILMDLSKALDCIPHDLLIAKLNAHSVDRKSLVFFSYLKRRKQCINVNNIQIIFQTLLFGVPQGLILGPLLLNIFINDLIGFIKRSSLYNFADGNTITAFEKDITLLKETLQNEAEIAIQWFKDNFMIVNPGKFQAMVINRFGKMENKHEMYIENKKITFC